MRIDCSEVTSLCPSPASMLPPHGLKTSWVHIIHQSPPPLYPEIPHLNYLGGDGERVITIRLRSSRQCRRRRCAAQHLENRHRRGVEAARCLVGAEGEAHGVVEVRTVA